MPEVFIYFFKLSVGIAVVYLFYQLVLRRLTFYTWNRWYLLLFSVLAFLIPFINITPLVDYTPVAGGAIDVLPSLEQTLKTIVVPDSKGSGASSFDEWDITLLLFLVGAIIGLARLCIQLLSYVRIRSKAQLIIKDTIRVYQVKESIIPFSFGNSIFISHSLQNEEELKEILRHEYVHVQQKHTVDMLFSELLCIINWYNPFAWLLRHSIRQNLEFIADHRVLESGFDKKQYQYLLLKVIGSSRFKIANQFNLSSLKKRIVMMNKHQSHRVQISRFLFVLPLVVLLLLSFRTKPVSSGIELSNEGYTYNPVSRFSNDSMPHKKAMNTETGRTKDKIYTLKTRDGKTYIMKSNKESVPGNIKLQFKEGAHL